MAIQHHPPGNGKAGQEIASATRTASFTEAIAGAAQSADIETLTITGDGVNEIILEAFGNDHRCNSTTGQSVSLIILDDTTIVGASEVTATSDYRDNCYAQARVAAFSGEKTFRVRGYKGDSGTDTYVLSASATTPFIFRATWA